MAKNLLPDVEPRPKRGSSVVITPEFVAEEAERQKVDPVLAISMVKQESRGNPNARSKVGAQGAAQLMPGTGQYMARKKGERYDPSDSQQNVRLGIAYLKEQLDEFGGDYEKALAAYNAGPGRVRKAGGVPRIKETQDYVKRIRNGYGQIAASLPDVEDAPKASAPSKSKPTTPTAIAPATGESATDEFGLPSLPTVNVPVQKVLLPDVPGSRKSVNPQNQKAGKPAKYQPQDTQEAAVLTQAKPLPGLDDSSDIKILSPEESAAKKAEEEPFVLRQSVSAKDGVRRSPAKPATPTENFFQAQDVRPVDRTAGAPEPDARASQQSLALRFSEQQSRQFAKATPERKQQMIIGSYVNSLPAEDRKAASRAIERLRSYAPEEFDRAMSEQNSMRDVDPRVATWAKPGDKELTLSVDSMIPELVQAYKQGGAVAFDSLYGMRNEERAQFGRERDQQMQERQAQVEAVKQDFGQRDASGSGKAKALGTIAASALSDSVLGVVGGAADITGALAGKFGLDALDRRLTDFADTEVAKQEAIRRGQDQQQSQADLSNLSASGARLVGQLPVIAGSVMAGGGGGGGAASMFTTSMLGSTREEPLKAMVNAYVDALSVGIGTGGEKTARALLSGASKEAAADILVMTPDFAQIAALKAYAAQNPGKVSAAEMAEADKKLEKLTADALAAAIFAGAESASDARVLKRVHDKLATVDPTMTSSMSVLEATVEIGRRAMGRPAVQQAARAVEEQEARAQDALSRVEENQKRWKRGEVTQTTNPEVELAEAQAQAQLSDVQLDEAVTAAMEPPTKDIAQLSDVQKLAALTTEQIKSGKQITPIPADATVDQVKEIYRQRVQDFGTDSVAAAEAWQKVRELSPEVQLQSGKDRFYALPDAEALLSRLGNEIGSPKGIKEIDALIRKNKINGLTAEDIAGDYLSKEQAEADDLKAEYEKMGLPTDGVVQGRGVKAVPSQVEGKPDTGGRVIDLEADLEAERQRLAAQAEGKRKADQQEAALLAEAEQRAAAKAEAQAQANEAEKIRLVEQEKAEKEAQKIRAKQEELQRAMDEKQAVLNESAQLVEQQRARYTESLAQNDYVGAARSLKQIEAQMKFQLREKPTTPAEAAMYAEREADLEDIQVELKRLQNLQKVDADNGKPAKPSGPLFSQMASDPDYVAQQQRMDNVEADRKWLSLAEESRNRKLTDEEKVALKSPIEYLKHATMREGIRIGTSGERAMLNAKESGVVGLTNKGSKFSTADAQVILDEGGFALPDGRRFIDPSVTENDVVDFLIESGKTARSEMADVDAELAAQEEEYLRKKLEDEGASRDINADYGQQPNIDTELAEFDQGRRGEDVAAAANSPDDVPASIGDQVANDGGDLRDGASLRSSDQRQSGNSPFVQLRDANTDRIARIREVTVASPEGRTLVAELREYAKANGIEQRHVDALVSDLINDEFARAKDADANARKILGETAYKDYSQKVENADEEFNKLADRIARGSEDKGVTRQFIAAAKRAGFTEADGLEILRRARQIALRSQESAKRVKEAMGTRRARGRRAIWAAENQRLTETYGGQFVDSAGHDVNVRIFSRTGRNQVVVEYVDSAGDVFDRFTTSEHYLEAGLLGASGLDSVGRSVVGLSGFARMTDAQLRQAVSELNQLISHGYEEIRSAAAAGDIARVSELQNLQKDRRAYLEEGQLEWDKRGLRPSVKRAESKYRNPEWMALTDEERAAENQRAAKEWAAKVDAAAHEAATSPQNDAPGPTDGQKDAGNYRKGHVYLHGLDISIENPQGSTRSGVDPNGEPWEVEMSAHYGYLRRTEGADAENVDVYIGDDPTAERVFVVDQVDAQTKAFDEHKVILGVSDIQAAEILYDAHFSDGKGAERRAGVTEMALPEFKDWLKNGDTTKPVADLRSNKQGQPGQEVAVEPEEKTGLRANEPTTGRSVGAEKSIADIVDEEFDALFGEAKAPVDKPARSRFTEDDLRAVQQQMEEVNREYSRTVDPHDRQKLTDTYAKLAKRESEIFVALQNQGVKESNAKSAEEVQSLSRLISSLKSIGEGIVGYNYQVRYKKSSASNVRLTQAEIGQSHKDLVEHRKKAAKLLEEARRNYPERAEEVEKELLMKIGGTELEQVKLLVRQPVPKSPSVRTTKQAATAAVKNTAKGLDDIAKGLSELFGGPKMSSGLTFDEDTYAKAKPYFVQAMEHFKDAAGDVREVARRLLTALRDDYQFPVEAIAKMKPYIVRFIEENQTATVAEQEQTAESPQSESIFNSTEPELFDSFVNRLLYGEPFGSIVEARKDAESRTGKSYKAGTPEAKQLDELIEAAAVKAARLTIADGRERGASDAQLYDAMRTIYNKMPNLNVRTSTSIEQQAYSTPLPLAFAASHLAGINEQATVYEPSAGNGALLIGANAARVIANELNPERAKTLRETLENARVTQADATSIFIPDKVDVVIANPPFGVVKNDSGKSQQFDTGLGFKTTEIDHAIVFKSLQAMKDNGRAVLLVGGVRGEGEARRDKYNVGAKKQFYYHLYKNYNVVDHFTISGNMYAKQGAAFPVDVIVIEGKGQSQRALPAKVAPEVIEDYDQLGNKISAPRRVDASTESTTRSDSDSTRPATGQQSIFDLPVQPSASDDSGQRAGSGDANVSEPTGKRGDAGSVPAANGGSTNTGQRGATRAPVQSGRGSGSSIRQGTQPASANVDRGNDAGSVAERPAASIRTPNLDYDALKAKARTGAQSSETHRPYEKASSAWSLGSLIPVNLSKGSADALNALKAEVGDVDAYVREKLGYKPEQGELSQWFSAEQIDSIALAVNNLEKGKGFIIGDQCVAAETKIFNPVTGKHTPIVELAEKGERIHVLALTAEGLRAVPASAPFHKGEADLYRVTLEDGKTITVTDGHRFLTLDGWQSIASGLSVGHFLAYVPSLPANSSAFCLSVRALDDPHWWQKLPDSPARYRHESRSYDGLLHLVKENDQAAFPSQGDALARSRYYSQRDDLAALSGCSHLNQQNARLSRNSFSQGANLCLSSISGQNVAGGAQSSGLTRESDSLSRLSSERPHQLIVEALPHQQGSRGDRLTPLASGAECPDVLRLQLPTEQASENTLQLSEHLNCLGTSGKSLALCGDISALAFGDYTGIGRIVSIEFIRRDNFYDLWVPNYENYLAEGFINHNTGIGKGRVNAAIIVYALKRGKVPIFVTEKPKLYGDMLRDLKDIGHEDVQPIITNAGEEIPINDAAFAWYDAKEQAVLDGQRVPPRPEDAKFLKTGDTKKTEAELARLREAKQGPGANRAIFTTYSQMQTVKGQVTSRQQFLRDFAQRPSILILDESHNAGGGAKQVDEAGEVKLDRAQFVRQLIKKTEGTFYSSATFAKRPEVMDLYSKTDLRLIADNAEKLQEIFDDGGVPLQQIASAMLVESGQMVRRERSFEGIEYNTTPVQVDRETAENVSHSIQDVLTFSNYVASIVDKINESIRGEGSAGTDNAVGDAGASSTNFTSIMHNLVGQMLLALKADAAADLAIKSLQEGRKPIVTVANTMGSFIEKYVTEQQVKPGEEVNLTFADLLQRYLDRSREYREKNADGEVTVRYLTDEELGIYGVRLYEKARDFIANAAFKVPISPIDYLHKRLREAGYRTGEITGRMHTLEYDGDVARYRVRPTRETSTAAKAVTLNRYNEGDVDVLILNQSGSTGLSAHASEKYHDQRARDMIIAQAEANIDTHMQMLGRINRTGQLVLPRYFQLAADIPAELRPAAVLAKKMASLNANTTGARASAVTAKDALDFVNKYGDKAALLVVQENPEINYKLGFPVKENENGEMVETNAVSRLTGRLAALPIKQQGQVYELLEEAYRDILAQAEAIGENTLEAKTLNLEAEPIKAQVVQAASGNSPFTQAVIVQHAKVNVLGKPYTSQEVNDLLQKNLSTSIAGLVAASEALTAELKVKVNKHLEREQQVWEDALARRKQALEFAQNEAEPDGKKIEQAQKAVDQAERELAANQLRAENYRTAVNRVLNAAPVGGGVSLDSKAGSQYGIVVKIDAPAQLKGMSLASWKITVAVTDSSRQLKIPFSQLSVGDGSTAWRINKTSRSEVYNPATDSWDYVSLWEAFDKAGSLAREKRYIVSGNVLKGFAKFPTGQIVNYTDQSGVVHQGLLMPRKWSADKAINAQDVQLNAEQILQFLDYRGARVTDADKRMEINLAANGGGYLMTVPAAKQTGAVYYLNQGLRNLVGDFVKSSSKMVVRIPRAELSGVLDYLTTTGVGGDPLVLYATDPKLARSVLGLKAAADVSIDQVRGQRSEQGYARADLFVPQFAVDALRYIFAGGRKFAEWATPHLKEFGAKFRVALQRAWDEAKKFYKDERGVLNMQRVQQLFTRQTVAIPVTFNPVKFSADVVNAVNSLNLKPKKKQAALDAYNAAMVAVANNDGAALKKAQIELKRSLGKFGIGLLDITRPMMAGGELSVIGRQGGYHFLAHPILSGQALLTGFHSASEQGYHATLAELEAHPYFEKAKKAEVDFGVTSEFEIGKSALVGEENFSIGLAGKVPGLKHLERINKAFLDMQRLKVFAHGAEIIENAGGTPEEIAAGLKEWAKEVNRASGRGNIKEKYREAVGMASMGLFSPRFAISRLQLLDITRFARAYRKNPAAAKLQLADAVKVAGAVSALAGLAFLSGASVGDDPDDADFLKVQVGNVHFSLIPFGVGSYVKMGARMIKRAVRYQATGDEREIAKGQKQLTSFGRMKLAPLPGLVVDQMDQRREKGQVDTVGHNAIGEPKTLRQSVTDRLWPMFYQNVAETAAKEGYFNAVKKNAPEFFGADSQVYDEKEFIGRPADTKYGSNKLSAPEKRKARKEVFDTVSKLPAYAKLPDPFKDELMERQMDDAILDAERAKERKLMRSEMFRRESLRSDAAVVEGLQKLYELPDVKVMSRDQKRAAERAYYGALQNLRGRRADGKRGESLPELPMPSDLRGALIEGVKAGKAVLPQP